MKDRSEQILIVGVLFFTLSWIAVLLRVYVRTRMIKAFGKDDIAMLVTLFFFTAYMICQLGGVAHGTGKHRSALTDENAQTALRFWFFCEIFYTLATSVLKFAIGLFLLRITIEMVHIWIIRVVMACSGVFGIIYCFIVIFQCHPISFWWDLSPDAKGYCLSPSLMANTTYVVSALNSVADWTFGILPIFIVKDLQMKTSTKFIVASILGFAAIGSAATIIRMPYLSTVKGFKGDFLWRTADVAIWTTVELGVGITAGCMATLKPLLKVFLDFIGAQSSSLPLSTGAWPSPGPHGKGYSRQAHNLDDLRPTNDKSMTTTIVTGQGPSSNTITITSWTTRTRGGSSVEHTLQQSFPDDADLLNAETWKGGINRSVEVTTTEEIDSSRSDAPGASPSEERDYEGSLANKPAMAYERL